MWLRTKSAIKPNNPGEDIELDAEILYTELETKDVCLSLCIVLINGDFILHPTKDGVLDVSLSEYNRMYMITSHDKDSGRFILSPLSADSNATNPSQIGFEIPVGYIFEVFES